MDAELGSGPDQEPPREEQPWILPAPGESGDPMSSYGPEPHDTAGYEAAPLYGGRLYGAPLPAQPRTSGGWRVVSIAGILAVGAAAGSLVGHAVWQDTHSSSSPTAGGNPFGPNLPSGGNGYSLPIPGGGGGGPGDPFSGPGGATNSNTSDGPTDAAAIAHDVDPGVVDISTTVTGGEAAGTGMVLTSDGEVLTNNHVIDGATSISVRDVGNGKTYKATVVGYDRSHDIAVLQLTNASGLSTIAPAATTVSNGATVVAIGNAQGAGGTPSYAGGAITDTNASITASDEYDGTSEKLTGLLGTDAAVQSGDSGGPLVNNAGQVVGMDTAATAGDSNGFGFSDGGSAARGYAIPIATVLQVAQEIESGQSSETVHIGPTAELGVYANARSTDGVVIVGTTSGGPAAKAGIVRGDTVTRVDGHDTPSLSDLSALMAQLSPGQVVPVELTTESGVSRSVNVTLAAGPPQ